MNMTRSLFDSKNKFKQKYRDAFEESVRSHQADIKTTSLDELSADYKAGILVMMIIAAFGIGECLMTYFTLCQNSLFWPFGLIILFLTTALVALFEWDAAASLVATKRKMALTEKRLKHKAGC